MTKIQRIRNLFTGLVMLACAAFLVLAGADIIEYDDNTSIDAIALITGLIAIWLTVYALRMILFYFRMAKHMVGGASILYQGLLLLDVGLFAGSASYLPRFYILAYLIAINGFAGVLTMLRALNIRRAKVQHWKLMFAHGVVNLGLAVACIVFSRSELVIICIFSASLAYAAFTRIISAFRRTALVYIQ